MLFRPLLLFGLLLMITELYAQKSETITTGRPGQSFVPFTTGKGMLQFQQGVDYNQLAQSRTLYVSPGSQSDFLTEWQTPINENIVISNFIRYGILEKLELSVLALYKIGRLGFREVNHSSYSNSFSALDIGGRYNILEGKDKSLAWGVQLHVGLGGYLMDEIPDAAYPDLKLATSLSRGLWEGHGLTTNLGLIISDYSYDQLTYTLAYSLSLGEKWGVFLENYGSYILNDKAFINYPFQTYFDTGASYLLNNNVQIDVQGGYGNNPSSDIRSGRDKSFFAGAGISWRLQLE